MSVPEGHFQLYASMRPHLTAASYRFTTDQTMTARDEEGDTRPASSLPIEQLRTHVDVTSPRYALPPDQILSTWPPAGSGGSYGSRLPQIVIKRRTLPWERDVSLDQGRTEPWLALVVVAEDEAEIVLGAPVAECVTPGFSLPGEPDVATAAYLSIRQSMVDAVLPTQLDVPLLAHVREVDISDTEMMMGDDDGFVSVVVANRLPRAGADDEGTEVPITYHAALISLEGQFDLLLEQAPPPREDTFDRAGLVHVIATTAVYDHVVMTGQPPPSTVPSGPLTLDEATVATFLTATAGPSPAVNPSPSPGSDPLAHPRALSVASATSAVLAPDPTAPAYSVAGGWFTESTAGKQSSINQLEDYVMEVVIDRVDPKVRFPVLAHWSFTSVGDTTFESLMTGLHSGLLGTPPDPTRHRAPQGRPPLTVVETGHVELPHRTRDGDLTAAWYRGPLSPHPTTVEGGRLPLAHTSDQVRIVVPDGREDLSLATAFEIGRLLALSHPSLVDSLMRWRQGGFQQARGSSLLRIDDRYGLADFDGRLFDLPEALGLAVVREIVRDPDGVLGLPFDLRPPGTDMRVLDQLDLAGTPAEMIAGGLALDVDLATDPGEALQAVVNQSVHRAELDGRTRGRLVSDLLTGRLELAAGTLAASTLGADIIGNWMSGGLDWGAIEEVRWRPDAVNDSPIIIGGSLSSVGGAGSIDLTEVDLTDVVVRPRDALDDLLDGSDADGPGNDHTARAPGDPGTSHDAPPGGPR